jgi:hypothetical protein
MRSNPDLSALTAERLDTALPAPLQALWWLRKGGFAMGPAWETAHELCQQQEGDRAHDLVHALAHWIEGDMGNASYWYRRVGRQRALSIPEEWEAVAGELLGS